MPNMHYFSQKKYSANLGFLDYLRKSFSTELI